MCPDGFSEDSGIFSRGGIVRKVMDDLGVGGVFPSWELLPNYHTEAYTNCKCSVDSSGFLLTSSYI